MFCNLRHCFCYASVQENLYQVGFKNGYKKKCMGATVSFLEHYDRDGDEFFNIVTRFETWISHRTLRQTSNPKNGIIPNFDKLKKNSIKLCQLKKSWTSDIKSNISLFTKFVFCCEYEDVS